MHCHVRQAAWAAAALLRESVVAACARLPPSLAPPTLLALPVLGAAQLTNVALCAQAAANSVQTVQLFACDGTGYTFRIFSPDVFLLEQLNQIPPLKIEQSKTRTKALYDKRERERMTRQHWRR